MNVTQKIPQNLRTEFFAKITEVAKYIGCTVDELLCIMSLETSGTYSPNIVNPVSKAVGLIQFTPSTLKWLKYDYNEVKNMNHVEQLDVVKKYFKQFAKPKSFVDLYLTVFYPAAVGRSDGYVLGTSHENQKLIGKQNPIFNSGKPVTVGHVKAYLKDKFNGADVRWNRSNIAVVATAIFALFVLIFLP